MEKQIEGSGEMEREGEVFAKTLSPQKEEATVVGLRGELGSGKTTFVKGVARGLGVEGVVASPTFVIEKIYKLKAQLFDYLIHIDAYRLESGEELSTLGFDDLRKDPKNLIVIEWPEHVREVLGEDLKMLHFVFINSSTRSIKEHGKD